MNPARNAANVNDRSCCDAVTPSQSRPEPIVPNRGWYSYLAFFAIKKIAYSARCVCARALFCLRICLPAPHLVLNHWRQNGRQANALQRHAAGNAQPLKSGIAAVKGALPAGRRCSSGSAWCRARTGWADAPPGGPFWRSGVRAAGGLAFCRCLMGGGESGTIGLPPNGTWFEPIAPHDE